MADTYLGGAAGPKRVSSETGYRSSEGDLSRRSPLRGLPHRKHAALADVLCVVLPHGAG